MTPKYENTQIINKPKKKNNSNNKNKKQLKSGVKYKNLCCHTEFLSYIVLLTHVFANKKPLQSIYQTDAQTHRQNANSRLIK